MQYGGEQEKILSANRRLVTLEALLGIAADYWNVLRQTKMPLNQPDEADECYARALIARPEWIQANENLVVPLVGETRKKRNNLRTKSRHFARSVQRPHRRG